MFISKHEKQEIKARLNSLESDRWAARQMTCQDAARLTKKLDLLFKYLDVEEVDYRENKVQKRKKGVK